MSSAVVAGSAGAPRPGAAGGVRERFVEVMLVGGATFVLFPIGWVLRHVVGLDTAELVAGASTFYAAYVVNDPHFSVTYALFYKDLRARALSRDVPIAQRVRFWIAGLVVPAVLVAWAAAAIATRSAQALGWMIQLMYLLVGWHYVKQGFGVLTVLAARRGARMTARERTVLLAHAFAGWAFAWANPASPGGEFEEKGVVYWAPAHPRWLEIGAGVLLAASTMALALVLAQRKLRGEKSLPATPLLAFLVTVWWWTIFSSKDPIVQYLIPALHSVQYLYFVWLMKRNEARAQEGPPVFGRPVAARLGLLAVTALGLGWLLFHGAPAFLDGALLPARRGGAVTAALGDTPFFAAFFVVVSIHHYFMDSVVWRRENPDTRWLRDASLPPFNGPSGCRPAVPAGPQNAQFTRAPASPGPA